MKDNYRASATVNCEDSVSRTCNEWYRKYNGKNCVEFLEYNTNATNDIESASLTLNDNVSTTVRLWIV